MRCAVGPLHQEAGARRQHSRHRMHLGCFERFGEGEQRQDGAEPFGEHRFAGAGRPDHQGVVHSGGRHFERAFGRSLAADVAKVEAIDGPFARATRRGHRAGHGKVSVGQELDDVGKIVGRVDLDAFHHGGFVSIFGRHDQVRNALAAGADGNREHAANGPDFAVEGEFAHNHGIERLPGHVIPKDAHRSQDAERHRQIEAGTFLAHIRGSKVDGHRAARVTKAGVYQRGLDPFPALPDRGIGQPDGDKIAIGPVRMQIHLNVDGMGVDAKHGSTLGSIQAHML